MKKDIQCSAPTSALYIIGMIGAAVYFISNAEGFWMIVLSVLKAIAWPAILVFEALGSLGV